MRTGDYFLENCCGWSTFGARAAVYGYNGGGGEIWDVAINKSKEQLDEIKKLPGVGTLDIVEMDSINLTFDDNTFDFIYCNPPFMDSEKYSGNVNDIADSDFTSFISKVDRLMYNNFRVAKHNALCVITINDCRKNGELIPMQKFIIEAGLKYGFILWDFAIGELVKGRNLILRKREYELRRTAKQHEYIITFKKK